MYSKSAHCCTPTLCSHQTVGILFVYVIHNSIPQCDGTAASLSKQSFIKFNIGSLNVRPCAHYQCAQVTVKKRILFSGNYPSWEFRKRNNSSAALCYIQIVLLHASFLLGAQSIFAL